MIVLIRYEGSVDFGVVLPAALLLDAADTMSQGDADVRVLRRHTYQP